MAVNAVVLQKTFENESETASYLELNVIDPAILSEGPTEEHRISMDQWERYLTEGVRKILVAKYVLQGWTDAQFLGRWSQIFYLKR